MKILGTLLGVLMLAFAAVQLNDPDGLRWALIYGATAVALGLGAWRAAWLRHPLGRLAICAFVVFLLALVVLYWPEQRGFWRREIWWETEAAREGMGLMIALLASMVALAVAFTGHGPSRSSSRDPLR